MATAISNHEFVSRRTLLAGAATLPAMALATPAIAATGLTDPVVLAYDEWRRLEQIENDAENEIEKMFDVDQASYWKTLEHHRNTFDRTPANEALDAAISTPATTFAGLLCKVRIIEEFHGPCSIVGSDTWKEEMQQPGNLIISELMGDLKRLA